jgi:putative redox protein
MRAVVRAGPFDIVVDEPPSAGGEGSGPQPTDVFLASIASCFALAMAFAARRRGYALPEMEVEVTGFYDGPRFSRIDVEVACAADASVLDELLPEAQRVCYVTNTLREVPRLHFRYSGVVAERASDDG